MADYAHEGYWPQIKELAEVGKFQEIADMITKLTDRKERVALLRFAVRGLAFRDWDQKSLEPQILLGDLAIRTALEINEIDEANITCFNMSANLADCWNDGFTRTPIHFEKGLDYAKKAIEFRKQLKKGPGHSSMAYWAQGVHQFFLKDHKNAEESFSQSLKYAIEDAKLKGQPITVSSLTTFDVLISSGYMALARTAKAQGAGEELFDQVIKSLEEMTSISADAKADAEIGLDQLQYVFAKYL